MGLSGVNKRMQHVLFVALKRNRGIIFFSHSLLRSPLFGRKNTVTTLYIMKQPSKTNQYRMKWKPHL